MIYVECGTEEALARFLTSLPRREVVHENRGKGAVVGRVINGNNRLGLVDEDPGAPQPKGLTAMRVREDLPGNGLRLLEDTAKGNRLVILCPRFEEWLLAAAEATNLNMARYSLPSDGRNLHRVLTADLRKLDRLLPDLRRTDRLQTLRRLLVES